MRQPSGIREPFTSLHQAELDRLLGQYSSSQEEANAVLIKTQRNALETIAKELASDGRAMAAHQELAEAKKRFRAQRRLEGRLHSPTAATYAWDAQARNVIPDVRPGTNIFGLEYDYEVRADIHGAPVLTADRIDGRFGVRINERYNGGSDWGTAGVGKVLEATATGIAHVRAALPYEYTWSINAGGGLDAFTHGSGRIVVQDHNTGNVLGPDGIRWKGFWHWSDDDDIQGGDSGIVLASEIECSVSVHAGQIFNVTFLAHGNNSQSGEYLFSHSYASGNLQMSAPFFVVKL
ncbi:hypothetical protein ACF05T_17800 [Streptomyces lateritius]|uniref:Uncharacterized protein n=1 Tax=Streptomyces lateritius TaxID=67313 RepID=A0ABW6YDM2_9ACTN